MSRRRVDANVISELRKSNCDPAAKARTDTQPPESLHLSRVTLAEIRFGIERVTDATFRGTLLAWLDDTVRPWFAERILDIDAVESNPVRNSGTRVTLGERVPHRGSRPETPIPAPPL
ncbi:MAG: hypothetical protein P9C36_06690 [Defluviicoccus sp.]|nr:hypothetical protein [Defluviicoccus sp.]MDG4592296.1 hypothetical protein [Defluviicoccus sp.]